MLAALPSWIIDAGVLAGSTMAVLTAITAGVRSPVGKWVIRQISDDLADRRKAEVISLLDEHVPRHLSPILAQLLPNGGSSFRDELRDTRSLVVVLAERMDAADDDRTDLRHLLEQQMEVDTLAQSGRIDRRRDEP